MAARRPGTFCSRTGVVDRARQMVPASSIPEELIAQAQVVLQGKSRETIVRELQRTNLNVNEAVNNLLSRDDDEGDELDETSEAYLHEELLSLLDAGLRSDGSGTALIDPDNIYTSAEGYEYLVTRDLARRRDGNDSCITAV
jgi:E3 ubiquitin-protein ligase EDD1